MMKELLIFLFIVCIGCVDFRIPFLNYWDELCFLLAFVTFIYKYIKKQLTISREIKSSLLLLGAIAGIGLLGNIFNLKYQTNIIAIFKDVLAFVKFPLFLLCSFCMIDNVHIDLKKLISLNKKFIIFATAVAIVGLLVDIGVYANDTTRLFLTYEFFYQHCTYLIFSFVISIVIFFLDSFKNHKIYIIMACILIGLTQRTKGYFIIAIIILILLFGEKLLLFLDDSQNVKVDKRKVFVSGIIIASLAIMIGWDKGMYYWQYGLSAARPALYLVGIKIMFDFLPLGSGFGTFASYISGEYYSGIYSKYGIENVMGLTALDYSYISDVFWPYIYGQFGLFGILAYLILFYKLIKLCMNAVKNNKSKIMIVVVLIYAIYASVAEAFFTNTTSIQFAIILLIIIILDRNREV